MTRPTGVFADCVQSSNADAHKPEFHRDFSTSRFPPPVAICNCLLNVCLGLTYSLVFGFAVYVVDNYFRPDERKKKNTEYMAIIRSM